MNKEILQAKEAFLSGLDFYDACRSSFEMGVGTPVYDRIAESIQQVTGEKWKSFYFLEFSKASHPCETYLTVFDKALVGA